MPKPAVGRFVDEKARDTYITAYRAIEREFWPGETDETVVETSFGPTFLRRSGGGTGRPLVLLHPLAANGMSWHPLAADLGENRTILAVDTIGTAGRSVQTAPVRGRADFARWFDELITGLRLETPHVLGYSNGAWHAASVALHSRRDLASLTLIEPSGVLTRVPLTTLAEFFAVGARPSPKAVARLERLTSPGYAVDPREKHLATLAMRDFRARLPWPKTLTDQDLQRLAVPTHVILAGRSALLRPERAARRASAMIPDAHVTVFDRAGHALPFELREEVVPSVLGFLSRHDGDAR
ncbi:pimeloyl-ACP methyl ester carboxylesterase [Diaminobutyricimonas aerilata]|uniref:Pimeloyl-ACP methyl ester carboxylesterase n=1 Tax=Diaminobutyricimonas aerilata TaxID=1162967 RepID=A0A2M9CLR2_9MICO|nr:alpha/beta fold hydrolase [Diaminobutyricimonas aerilata]PJJ72830.1 pimeloyl-ACP methyl ester carboxylesterase [Diaminobutyricimonas aerilata]